MTKLGQAMNTLMLAAAGVVLYVPAAIGLTMRELMRPVEDDDTAWRFVLPGIEQERIVQDRLMRASRLRGGLWSQMRLSDYFSIVPGCAGVAHNRCIIDRSMVAA